MDNTKIKAQVSIEFVVSFVLLALFAVLAAKVFIWLSSTMINRHKAYERSRSTMTMPVEVDFFKEANGKRPMNLFNETK